MRRVPATGEKEEKNSDIKHGTDNEREDEKGGEESRPETSTTRKEEIQQ